ncbi:hypothetical protein G7Z17_g247 [Cylindrodendrum hubeiense]|uniref:3-carboxymuconate cyclase n=1 Tax=Cylindrodendrum hubeiense TaxID=595255 RepID=A0A9P5HI39_9HYPO|nr:hypothetical protein G7Z17_g247 [Cylindrodendrum hubeiense]
MRVSASFVLSSWLTLLVQESAARPSLCENAKSIYVMSNEDVNSVIAVPIGKNGKLFGGTSTATGGKGARVIDGTTHVSALTDGLVSQSCLTVAGHKLFAVNPGSNTVTMFSIDRKDATKLKMVGKPAAVPGEFPNTVAASKKHKIVCVGTSGAVAGVSCTSFSRHGMGAMDALRPFDLKQTTPPVGPLNTVSQVFFSEDQNTLFVTVKGDPTKGNTGFLASFPVKYTSKGAVISKNGIRSSPAGTAVLFGSSPIAGSRDIFVTDASFGGAVLSFNSVGVASVKGKAAIDGQKATCWSTISPETNTAFVTDVATNRLVEMSLEDASIISKIDLSANGDPGMIDLRAAGNFIYALSPGNGTTNPAVTVVHATKKVQVQHFELQGLGASNRAQGVAVLL